jgi:NADH-quinone oxidoreductase subunit A
MPFSAGPFAPGRQDRETQAMNSPSLIVGYLALFVGVGILFVFVNLLVGWLVRPQAPNAEKLEVYECGEPTIGSSFVQFDLRFYVVALLFIIFDVEVAFFFPWATVYGKAVHLLDPRLAATSQERDVYASPESAAVAILTPDQAGVFRELGVPPMALPTSQSEVEQTAKTLAVTSIIDIGVFFAVLLVGFAYVWRRGDLDWVRALSRERGGGTPSEARIWNQPEPVALETSR